MDATTMTQAFDQWFQLRLDSLRRQNEWRKIDCLLASKEYVRDAWEATQRSKNYMGFMQVPLAPTIPMLRDAQRADGDHGPFNEWLEDAGRDFIAMYRAAVAAAPKETK